MSQWIEETNQRDHQHTMEKLDRAVEIARAFAASADTRDFELDVHIDRYGDTTITVRVNRTADNTPSATHEEEA